MTIASRYKAYKDATAHVIDWVHKCTECVLDTLKDTSQEDFQLHVHLHDEVKRLLKSSSKISIRMVDTMLNFLLTSHDGQGTSVFSPQTCPSFLQNLPTTLSNCLHAIHLRKKMYRLYSRTTNTSNANELESNKKHHHFIEVMEVWHNKLSSLANVVKRAVVDGAGSAALHESFAMFASVVDSEDGDGSNHEEICHDVPDSDPAERTCTDQAIYGMQMEEEFIDQFDDIAFVLQALMVDMDEIMETVAAAWVDVRNGTSNFASASLVSLLAFRRVKELTESLEKEFPEIKSFEEFEAVLSQPTNDRSTIGELMRDDTSGVVEKLNQYATTREYPEGSLLHVMRVTAFFLRSFATAIPPDRSKLVPRVGFFGKSFDEMEQPVENLLDFGRLISDHLPLVFNEQLCLSGFFVDHDIEDDSPKFVFFKEVLDEFVNFFELGNSREHAKTTIPFVFIMAIWYNSVQVLQGGMLLSRITAITRKGLQCLAKSLDVCFTKHRERRNAPYFMLALQKVKYLEKRTSYFRNHPFMAGVITLDMAVSLALCSGVFDITASRTIQPALHLYNAMVRGADMVPSPVVEKFLAIHARAFFSPTRPSRNFLPSLKRLVATINHNKCSELYRILVLRERALLGSHDSFGAQVHYVCQVWAREFREQPLLGFNYSFFSRVLEAGADEAVTVLPSTDTWETRLTVLVGLCDNEIPARVAPMRKRAIGYMTKHLAKLSASPASLDILPRVAGSMHTALYGPLVKVCIGPESISDRSLFSEMMDLLGAATDPLTDDEAARVFRVCRDNPVILRLHDVEHGGEHMLTTGIVHHLAAGPRAHTELLECVLQLDGLRVPGPVSAIHACAATGNVEHLKLVLGALNYSERDVVCHERGNTPLHYAAQFGQAGVVSYLADLIVDCNVKNKEGKVALDLTASEGIKATLMEIQNRRRSDAFRIDSVPASVRRENERRWATEAQSRRERVRRRLAERREVEKKPVQSITAADEARARQHEAELLAMLEEEEKGKKTGSGKKKKKKKKKKGNTSN